MPVDGGIGGVGKAWIHSQRHIGGAENLPSGDLQDIRQTLPAELWVAIQPVPTARFICIKRGFKALWRLDFTVFQGAAQRVAYRVQRVSDVFGEFGGLLQGGGGEIRGDFFESVLRFYL